MVVFNFHRLESPNAGGLHLGAQDTTPPFEAAHHQRRCEESVPVLRPAVRRRCVGTARAIPNGKDTVPLGVALVSSEAGCTAPEA